MGHDGDAKLLLKHYPREPNFGIRSRRAMNCAPGPWRNRIGRAVCAMSDKRLDANATKISLRAATLNSFYTHKLVKIFLHRIYNYGLPQKLFQIHHSQMLERRI